jgi:hypothetical protein
MRWARVPKRRTRVGAISIRGAASVGSAGDEAEAVGEAVQAGVRGGDFQGIGVDIEADGLRHAQGQRG